MKSFFKKCLRNIFVYERYSTTEIALILALELFVYGLSVYLYCFVYKDLFMVRWKLLIGTIFVCIAIVNLVLRIKKLRQSGDGEQSEDDSVIDR